MDFSALIKTRQSVRAYESKPVKKDKIMQCVEAARLAPSACNSQPWTFIIADEPDKVEVMRKAVIDKVIMMNRFARNVPAFAVIVMEKMKTTAQVGAGIKDREYRLMDIGIAAEHFCLQAAELGLGTCMIGWFNEKTVKHLLNIPDKKRIALVISIGYPVEDYRLREKIRKPLMEMCKFNSYQ